VGCFVAGCCLTATAGEQPREIPEILETTAAIHIDGRITPEEWKHAASFEIAYEVSPGENTKAPVRTEVWICSDQDAFYAAFRCLDPETKKIRARYHDRDELWEDDWVQIVLDTFNDERRAYEFAVNPLGVQMDAVNDEVNGSYDTSWDAIWDSAGRLTTDGWEVEIRIPFRQLRFKNTASEKIWGIDLVRSWPRSVTHHIGLFPRERGSNSYLSQLNKIRGFANARTGRNLEMVPTLTSTNSRERQDFPGGSWGETESSLDAGFTLGWGVTPNMTLAAAVHPDFSQVEADAVQLDINTTFALYYPESRPFFLIAADTFETGLPLLHTRTIADPSVALKWTGKIGAHTFGILSARDDITNLIVPGFEGSMMGSFEESNLLSAGRWRMDFGANSTAGIMITDREGRDGYSNRVYASDLQYRLSSSDQFRLNLACSTTRYSKEMGEYFGLEQLKFDGHAADINYRHSVRNWQAWFSYSDADQDFRADAGFQPMVDYRRYAGGFTRHFWGDSEGWYTRISAGVRYSYEEQASTSALSERSGTLVLSYTGPLQSHVGFFLTSRDQLYREQLFPTDGWAISSSIRPGQNLSLFLFVSAKDWIDFAAVKPADYFNTGITLGVNAGRHISLDLSWDYSDLDRKEGKVYTARISGLRSVYQFNLRCFFRMILQYVQLEQNPALSPGIDSTSSEDLFTQLLFSYKLNARTVFFLGYSDRALATDTYSLTRSNQSVFAKLGYSFLF